MFLEEDNNKNCPSYATRTRCLSSSHPTKRQQKVTHNNKHSTITMRRPVGLFAVNTLLLIALQVLSALCQLNDAGLNNGGQEGTNTNSQSSMQHQEILVQPNSQVRIECKIPHMSPSDLRSYYWNFQRTASGQAKPYILCFESKCLDETGSLGIQLEMDRESGGYDLLINNVTYELNDGLYYCDYKDSNPASKQTINREFRLTVLSKYLSFSVVYFSLALYGT